MARVVVRTDTKKTHVSHVLKINQCRFSSGHAGKADVII